MRSRFLMLGLTAIAFMAGSAPAIYAQMTGHKTNKPMEPGNETRMARQLTTTEFLQKATVSNMFEITSSELALERTQNADIRQFAQHMINDHKKATQDMKAAIADAGLTDTALPETLDSKHQVVFNGLQELSDSFDSQYINAQVMAHNEAVTLFSTYIEEGDNPAIREFAARTLPTLQMHKQMITELNDKYS